LKGGLGKVMATKKTSKKKVKKDWQENYASFILGAIIVVILGLLVANFITNRNKDIAKTGEQSSAMSEEKNDSVIANGSSKDGYKVQANDSLSKIAEKVYGDKMLWPVLAKANDIKNPNLIYVDMSLTIPTKEEAGKVKEAMSQTSYTVNNGDTLFKIAETVYGDGSKWRLIDSANKVGRLPNGNPLIFAGNTLVIPR
jgi:nucleoid-associated protein YgaU